MRVFRLRIPRERIGVAIGSEGKVKEEIEDKADAEIDFNSGTGEVTIKTSVENPLKALATRDVLKAIGRGFSPKRAFRLFEENVYLQVMDITGYAGSPKAQSRLKGRVIGQDGRTRRFIEERTGVLLSVYGKTISLIGEPERLEIAREAINMLLEGSPHSAVYNFMDRKMRKIKKRLLHQK